MYHDILILVHLKLRAFVFSYWSAHVCVRVLYVFASVQLTRKFGIPKSDAFSLHSQNRD